MNQSLKNVLDDLEMLVAEQATFEKLASKQLVEWIIDQDVAPTLCNAGVVSEKRAEFDSNSDDYAALGMLMVYTTRSTAAQRS